MDGAKDINYSLDKFSLNMVQLCPMPIVGKPPTPSAPKYKNYLDIVGLGGEINYLPIKQIEDVDRKKARYSALKSRMDEK